MKKILIGKISEKHNRKLILLLSSLILSVLLLLIGGFNLFNSQVFNKDDIKPVILLNGEPEINVEVNDNYQELGATVTDNVDQYLDLTITGFVNTGVIGTYEVRYNSTDKSGNKAEEVVRIIRVVDTTKPTLTLNGAANIKLKIGESYTDPGYMVFDNYDGLEKLKVTKLGSVNVNALGTYVINYTVEDSSGNKSETLTRNIDVERETFQPSVLTGAVSLVTIDINPSIIIALDSKDKVINTFGSNNDGINLLVNLNITAQTIEQVIDSIIQKAEETGFINSKDAILIGIESNNIAKRNALESLTKSVVNNKANELGKEIGLLVEKLNLDLDKALKTINGDEQTSARVKVIEDIKNAFKDSSTNIDDFNILDLIVKKKEIVPPAPVFGGGGGGGGGGGAAPAPTTYTITFNANGGSNVSSITSIANAAILQPANPNKEGHTFEGWFSNSDLTTPFLFSTMPAVNTTLYAKWSEITVQTIELNILYEPKQFARWTIGSYYNDLIILDNFNVLHNLKWNYISQTFYYSSILLNLNDFLEINENIDFVNLIDGNLILITSNSRVLTYGSNFYGQLGNGNFNDNFIGLIDISSQFEFDSGEYPVEVYMAKTNYSTTRAGLLTSLGRVFLWGSLTFEVVKDQYYSNVPLDVTGYFNFSNPQEKIISFKLAKENLFLTNFESVFGWGSPGDGTIPVNYSEIFTNLQMTGEEKVLQTSLIDDGGSIITSNNRLLVWGTNYFKRISEDGYSVGPIELDLNVELDSNEKIVRIIDTYYRNYYITDLGRVFLTGKSLVNPPGPNSYTIHYPSTPLELNFTLENSDLIWDIYFHTGLVIYDDNKIKWGRYLDSSEEQFSWEILNIGFKTFTSEIEEGTNYDLFDLFNLNASEYQIISTENYSNRKIYILKKK